MQRRKDLFATWPKAASVLLILEARVMSVCAGKLVDCTHIPIEEQPSEIVSHIVHMPTYWATVKPVLLVLRSKTKKR